MNENINLAQILKDCPRGTELYSSILGKVTFFCINNLNSVYPIKVKVCFGTNQSKQFTKQGTYYPGVGECTLFPSENQRDWSKFSAPWLKKEKFDPKTFKVSDKILLRDECGRWHCGSFSHINKDGNYKFGYFELKYKYCIPYNEETRYLISTTEEAPEYYRYWKD